VRDENPDRNRRLAELLALVAAAGGYVTTPPPRMAHHVSPDRLWRILDSINLKSILYSPLDGVSAVARVRQAPLFQNRTGTRNFMFCLRSLSHKWSVCGHRFATEEEGIIPSPVYCCTLDSTGRYLVSGADDSLIKIWDVQSGILKCSIFGHRAEICDIAFSPMNDQYLASLCSEDSTVLVWRKDDSGKYGFRHKIVEIDPSEVSRRLTPIYMTFYPNKPTPSVPLKLIVAYTNGTVVVHEFTPSGGLMPFGQIHSPLGTSYELKSFAAIQPDGEGINVAHLLIGLNKPNGTDKYVYGFTVKKRGPPECLPHAFPSSIKSPITHISVANKDWSFVASDDEVSSVMLYKQRNGAQFDKFTLIKSFVSGGASLVDGYPLFARIEELVYGRVTNEISRNLRVTVDITLWSENDDLVFVTMAGTRYTGPDDASFFPTDENIYCCLVFETSSGSLVGVLGLTTTRGNIFNAVLVDPPTCMNAADKSTILATASHDGKLVFYRIERRPGGVSMVIETITTFDINISAGSNRPRSILDLTVRTSDDGDIICAISDSLGTISVFSALSWKPAKKPPAEQFVETDYTQLGSGVTYVNHEDELCDARLVRLSELEVRTPEVLHLVKSDSFANRWLETKNEVVQCASQVQGGLSVPSGGSTMPTSFSSPQQQQSSPERQRGRPPLSEDERIRRAAALSALAARAAARTTDGEYSRTSTGRIVRNRASVHEDELELYENSEIDDSDYLTDSSSSSDGLKPEESPAKLRIRARARTYTLECNKCGAIREVEKDVYDEYTDNNKRVRCRWIHYNCEDTTAVPSSSSNEVPPRKRPLSLPFRQEESPERRPRREEDTTGLRRSTRNK
jgi:WD40 repeat protein